MTTLTTTRGPRDDDALSLALSQASPVEVSAWLREQVAAVKQRGGRIESTRRAYTAAAMRILPFLDAYGLNAATVDADQAAAALLALAVGAPPYSAPCATSSVRLTATAIRIALVSQGQDPWAWCSKVVRNVLKDLDKRNAPKSVTPIRLDDLRRMVSVVAPTGHGVRIRAAMLTMYSGALRVSELSSLCWGRVRSSGPDLVLQIRRKRHNEWCQVYLLSATEKALCPVAALIELRRADAVTFKMTTEETIFGGPRTVQGWVTALATRAGIQGAVSPHSLRHGWASDAASAGIPLPAIQAHLGHLDPKSTARYAAHADLRRFY